MHPPSSFSPGAEKKKSAVHGGEEKEGFWVQTCQNRASGLLRRWLEPCVAWRSVVTLLVLLAALRAGAKFGRCAVRSLCFCCASIAWVYRGCTAANLLRCASPSAVAAQCAGAKRGRCTVRCVSFCCASVVQMCRDTLRQGCSVVLLFPLLLRNALCGCAVGKYSVLSNGKSIFLFFQRTTPLQHPSAPRGGSRRRRTIFPLFRPCPLAKGNHRPAK